MALDELITKLNKNRDFPISFANAPGAPCVVADWISTGCLALDYALGGGLPVGRIVEIYGDTSTGKTLIAEMAVLTALEAGHIVVYMDTERAVSLELMEQLGIDTGRLIYADPDTIEEVFQLMEDVLLHKEPEQTVLFVWDSIAATTATAEADGGYDKSHVGVHARLISQGLRKFNRLISKHNAVALFLNQTRQKIGIMFGDDEATFGGKAVAFYSSIRVRLRKGKKIKNGKTVIGITGHAIIVKNKVAVPFKEVDLPIYFGEGVDDAEASLLYLKATGDVSTKGAWSTIELNGKTHKFQGPNWHNVFDANYDAIADLILGVK